MKLIILLIAISLSFSAMAVRPSPAKSTAEILNDVYDDFDGATHTAALWVNLQDKAVTTSPTPITMTEGIHVDFIVTNIAAGSFTTVYTLTSNSSYMSITHNGGGKFDIARNGTKIGVLAPGEVQYVAFDATTGDTIGLESESGTVSTGDVYFNFFN